MARHTLTVGTSAIDTGTGNKHVVYDGENAFTTHPASITIFDLAVVEYSGFVELDGSTMYGLREALRDVSRAFATRSWHSRYLVRVEIFPA